ncbi:MAG: DNA primase [Clostridiales bacterium]|nr:DNA primase [Clostridiales bacterium]
MDKEFSDFITSVLDKTDIVSVISRYAKLDRKGNTYWACCPFHHETQPSFSVSPDKQFYHCFGCKESGNAISFLKKIENIEFIDALRMLAEQAGMEMPKPKAGTYVHIDKKRKELLLNLMRDAARHYHENLSSPRAKIFNDYLRDRQLPPEMVRRFGMGASLDFTEMLDYLESKGYTYEQMHAVGIAEKKDGRAYDVFGKRLIIPIIDNMNNVVSFGGRTLEKDVHFAKYRNGSQTEVFDKSQVVYGVNLLKKRKNKNLPIDYVIMVEGYMDVIALHKAGFETAVASMGTALTTRQARQIKLYSDLVYISYDGDTAGQKAILRGLDILRETGITVKVVRLPNGLDPDDVIKQKGASAYQKLLDEAVPLTTHKIEVLRAGYDMRDPDERAKFAVEAVAVVNNLGNAVEQDSYLKTISDITGFPIDALKRQSGLSALAKRMPAPQPRSHASESVDYNDTIMFFLSALVRCRDYVDYDKQVVSAMPDDTTARLYEWCREHRTFSPTDIYNEYGYDNVLLNKLFDRKELPGDGRQKFVDVQNELYRRVLDKESERLTEMLKTTSNKDEIMRQIGRLSSERSKLSKYRS